MGKKIKVDLTGVESFQRASEGEHTAKIVSAEVKQSQGGNDMVVVCFEVTKGDDKGSRVYENYPLIDTALWKLKGLLQAIGMKADGKVQIDLDKLVGKVVTIVVKHEEYEGKIRAKIDEVRKFSVAASDDEDDEDEDDDLDDEAGDEDDEEEEEEAPKKKAPAKKAPAKKAAKKSEPEEDEDDDDDDWDDDDEDEEEEEEKPAKKAAKKAPAKATKKAAPKKKAPEPEEDDDDDDWDDDEDDDE